MDGYRYGFNGKEKDDEIKGEGVQYDYGFRIYDARLGKFLSTDPLFQSYPSLTPYQYASNTPIAAIDLDGLEALITTDYKTLDDLKKDVRINHYRALGSDILQVSHKYLGKKDNDIVINWVEDGASETDLQNAYKEIQAAGDIGFWDKIDIANKYNISKVDLIIANSNVDELKAIKNITYEKRGFQLKNIGVLLATKLKNTDLLISDAKQENAFGLTNSFRHVAGQAMLTFFFGKDVTDWVADKHELKKEGLANGTMPNLEVQEKIDTYVDLVNNTWGQKLGGELKTKYANVSSYSNKDAENILNEFVDYFNDTWDEPILNRFDQDKSADDKKIIKAFQEFLNYAKKKSE